MQHMAPCRHLNVAGIVTRTLVATTLAFAPLINGPLKAQDDSLRDIELTAISNEEDFRYARALFPPDSDPGDETAVHDLPPSDRELLQRILSQRLNDLVEIYRTNKASIFELLRVEGVSLPSQPAGGGPIELEVVGGPNPVAAAGDNGRIVVSAVTLRGFLVGAVRSGVAENTSEGSLFRMALGWGSNIGGDQATWDKRIGSLLDAGGKLEAMTVPVAVQQEAVKAMYHESDEPTSPPFFDTIIARTVAGGGRFTPSEAYRLSAALMFLTTYLHGAEERFLLAHELGHLILRHVHRTDCARSARQEIDADAFAVALLNYEVSAGMVDLVLFGDPSSSFAENYVGSPSAFG